MDPVRPDWQPFDPADDRPPLSTPAGTSGDDGPSGGRVVVLLVEEDAGASWAADTALELARARSDAGERVLLLDLALREPRLHTHLDVPLAEGVSDVFLFGVSLGRVARPVGGDHLLFAPAGAPVADPAAVLGSSRWDALTRGFHAAGATLLLFLPADEPGGEAVLRRADEVVLLGSPDGVEDLAERLDALGAPAARVALGDPAAARAAPAAPDTVGAAWESEPVEEDVPPVREPGTSARETVAAPGPEPDAAERERRFREEEFASPAREAGAAVVGDRPLDGSGYDDLRQRIAQTERGRGRRLTILLVLLLLVVVAGVLAALFGWVDLPGIEPILAGGGAAVAAGARTPASDTAPASTPAAAVPVEPATLGWALTLGAYRDAAVARLQADALGARRPDLHFSVVPVRQDGDVWHRLLVGPAVDSVDVLLLRDDLAGTLDQEDPEAWIVRRTPLAWAVRELPTEAAARAAVDSLEDVDVSAYVLAAADTFRVFVGAYADSAEATPALHLLEDAGVRGARLTRRTGLPPAPAADSAGASATLP